MDEQQMNEDLLCDADRQLIASAARSQKYVEAPVPAELLNELSDDLLNLAFIPYASRSKLSSLYGPGLDFMSLISADWREAFSPGRIAHAQRENDQLPDAYRDGERRGCRGLYFRECAGGRICVVSVVRSHC